METTPKTRSGPQRPTPDPATAAVPAIDGIDAGPMLKLLGGNVDRYRRLLQTFAQYHADDVAALQAAAAGGAVPGQRLHALKGSAATVGADELHRLAAAIDDRLRQGEAPGLLAADLLRLADALQRLLLQIGARLPADAAGP